MVTCKFSGIFRAKQEVIDERGDDDDIPDAAAARTAYRMGTQLTLKALPASMLISAAFNLFVDRTLTQYFGVSLADIGDAPPTHARAARQRPTEDPHL